MCFCVLSRSYLYVPVPCSVLRKDKVAQACSTSGSAAEHRTTTLYRSFQRTQNNFKALRRVWAQEVGPCASARLR